MTKTVIKSENAPASIAAYSQAIKAGGFIFVSGQVALDPKNGHLIGRTAAEQTVQALKNVSEILKAAGSSMEKVVKCTVLLNAIDDYSDVNKAYSRFFPVDPPARAAYAVDRLPLGALVEIEVIALA